MMNAFSVLHPHIAVLNKPLRLELCIHPPCMLACPCVVVCVLLGECLVAGLLVNVEDRCMVPLHFGYRYPLSMPTLHWVI